MSLQYPLLVKFKAIALAEQISVRDAAGNEVFYVKQKLFKLREKIEIYKDSSREQLLYTIQADKVIDWSPEYTLSDTTGAVLGRIKRNGARSLWKADYNAHIGENHEAHIHEVNPWVKVADALFESIPFVGLITGYFLHPKYAIDNPDGQNLGHIVKLPAFLEGKFTIEGDGLAGLDEAAQQHLNVLLMITILLERQSG